jgi:hypothetical protein
VELQSLDPLKHESEGGGRKSIILVEGSQASPACPSDKGSVKVKTLGWLEALA